MLKFLENELVKYYISQRLIMYKMADQRHRYSTENEFIVKNKNVIIYLLGVITFFILIGFTDYYVLPVSKKEHCILHGS